MGNRHVAEGTSAAPILRCRSPFHRVTITEDEEGDMAKRETRNRRRLPRKKLLIAALVNGIAIVRTCAKRMKVEQPRELRHCPQSAVTCEKSLLVNRYPKINRDRTRNSSLRKAQMRQFTVSDR